MYTPPSCSSIAFTSSGSYIIPECGSIFFNIGGDIAPDIISANSFITLSGSTSEVTTAFGLNSHDSHINLGSTDSTVEWLVEFNSADAAITLTGAGHSVEILPDIVNASSGILLSSTQHICTTPTEKDLPIGTTPPANSYVWGHNVPADIHHTAPFAVGEDVLTQYNIPWKKAAGPDHSINCTWAALDWKDNTVAVGADAFNLLQDRTTAVPWGTFAIADKSTAVNYGFGDFYTNSIQVSYLSPDPKDVKKCTSWSKPTSEDWHIFIPYAAPTRKDVSKCRSWGPFSYYKLCDGDYYPPTACYSISFNFPSKYELIEGVCSDIRFEMDTYSSDPDPRCPYDHWHSGDRDVGSGIIVGGDAGFNFPRAQKVYYMLNTVLVKEYITNHPIEVLNVSATIDRSSWLWQFSVTVASRDCLEVVKPETGVFKTIVIEINGYVWHCTVESWSENRAFGKDAWTITGRSPSMMFGSPMDIKHSGVDTSNNAGGQIVDALIANKTAPTNWPVGLSSWDADWSAYDNVSSGFETHSGQHWGIPANTLSYSDQTTIEIIKQLTESIGAYIQTDASANTFNVKPMYKNQPWNWDGTEDEYKGIVEDQCVEISRSYSLQPYYNEILIVGESARINDAGTGADADGNSIYTKVWNNDGFGTTQAPMVTDTLLTTSKAAVERGRTVLGNTKEWVNHTLRLSTLCPPGVGNGLFLPGQMIAVKERGIPWYGQVTSIVITTSTSGNGFTTSQIIGVEEYIGENN